MSKSPQSQQIRKEAMIAAHNAAQQGQVQIEPVASFSRLVRLQAHVNFKYGHKALGAMPKA